MHGFVDIVKLLLRHGANVNSQSFSGNTALHHACTQGKVDAVSVLLDHSADIEHQNEKGHTPLMEAAISGHCNMASVLLKRCAEIIKCVIESKESPLTFAYCNGK